MKQKSAQLRPYERHVACMLSALLAGLGLLVTIEGRKLRTDVSDPMSVHVVGAAVESQIVLPQGSTLDDVLARLVLDENADCTALDGSRRLGDGETIVIPYVGMTTVYVTGAVTKQKVVVLDKNAKPREVLTSIQLRDDADVSSFLRRRVLRNGSVIEIKRKKQQAKITKNKVVKISDQKS